MGRVYPWTVFVSTELSILLLLVLASGAVPVEDEAGKSNNWNPSTTETPITTANSNNAESSDLNADDSSDTNASVLLARVQNATKTRELLIQSLFDLNHYDKRTYPSNLTLKIGMTLMSFQFLERFNILSANIWMTYEWNDVRLRWNPKDFGGESDLSVDKSLVWLPDIRLFNPVDSSKGLSCVETRLVVRSSGKVTEISPCTAAVFCTNNNDESESESGEERVCHFKMGSWTMDGNAMNVELQSEEDPVVEVSSFKDIDEYWGLSNSTTGFRNANYYACCPEPYIDINFNIGIKKKTKSEKNPSSGISG